MCSLDTRQEIEYLAIALKRPQDKCFFLFGTRPRACDCKLLESLRVNGRGNKIAVGVVVLRILAAELAPCTVNGGAR